MKTEILQHQVEWDYFNVPFGDELEELPEMEEDHIKEMIEQGYNEGELNYYDSRKNQNCRGWWKIVK